MTCCTENQKSFRREARTIAQLAHPHIIGVHDFGIEDQTPYLVMEYTPNGTLRSRHPKGTCLPFEQIVAYVKQIASALDYAHEQHVIHRDIKLENILLNTKHDVVLSDFGLAVVQRTQDSLSTQSPAGTPLYMAPEQIQRKPCAASDQYALGVMVYEWLCGETPFRGSLFEVFSQHLHEPPPSLRERLPHLPPAVEDVVFGALAKEPRQRFGCVADFATVLEEACFATQPLWLRGSVEPGSQDQIVPSVARTTPVSVPSRSEQDCSNEATQPRLKVTQRIDREPELVSDVSPRPPTHSQIVSQQRPPVSIVCVCAPSDLSYLSQWETHLRPLEHAGYLTVWSERHLLAGAPRTQQINEHLEQADLLVLLLSADFFASDDCIALMERALSRHLHGEVHLMPLLLRPVAWRESPLAPLSCVPSNHLPVIEWTSLDAAFEECVREVRRILGRPTTSARTYSQAPASALQNQNRLRLLRRVRSFWITGVLEHSLYGAALMALGLQEQPDAVANPWHLVLQHLDSTPRPLPAGTSITQVYDASDGELLILGAPGSGKTTLLLELARELLSRAERDEQHPLPVVFNLSSWAIKRLPLANWLAEELIDKYQVPSKLAQTLLRADQILPLLDGLDEVSLQQRTACSDCSLEASVGCWLDASCSFWELN